MTSFESIENLHRRSRAHAELPDSALPEYSGETAEIHSQPLSGNECSSLELEQRSTRWLAQAQKMEAIGRVTGGIAHNFNNLLTGIIGYCDLITSVSRDTDQSNEYLEQITRTACRCGDLVKQLLAFSQQQIMLPEPLQLNEIVIENEQRLHGQVDDKIELVTELDPSLLPVSVDAGQFEQLVKNLTANALEAMPDGGRLTLTTRQRQIAGHSTEHLGIPQGNYVLLSVEDTGRGIDESIFDRIFEPFFSTKSELNGTGLGLAVVYGIVRQSGGQIRVDSSPETGTRIDVYLPVSNPLPSCKAHPAAHVAEAAEHSRTPERFC